MKSIGILCNCTADADPLEQLSPSVINRAFLIDERLAPSGIRVFLYSPRSVTGESDVEGYRIEGTRLVPDRQPVPRVNANWTYATRRLLKPAMGYRGFQRWARDHGVEIYVPYAFSELVSNKKKAYDVVCRYDAALHPHTENLTGSPQQVEEFLERSGIVFVKPRAGNKGNRIFVLRRAGSEVSLTYYDTRARRSFPRITIRSALALLDVAGTREKYIVQEGVDSLRYRGAVFDVRVVMVHDGREWHGIHETRLAPLDSDLSNVFQGGSIQITEDLLASMLGEKQGRAMEDELRRVSHGLAEHLESDYPGELPELGFDFVIGRDERLHLVEVNAKPGVSGIGSEVKIFDWKSEDAHLYDRWVRPHAEYLAAFLQHRIEAVDQRNAARREASLSSIRPPS